MLQDDVALNSADMENISNSLGFGASQSDQKTALMNQIRQEAAIQNARQLVEVRVPDCTGFSAHAYVCLENQRALL